MFTQVGSRAGRKKVSPVLVIQTPAAFVGGGEANLAFGSALSTTIAFFVFQTSIPFRKTPTGITISSATHFNATNGAGTGIELTNLTFNTGSPHSFSVLATVASGLTLGQGSALQSKSSLAKITVTGA